MSENQYEPWQRLGLKWRGDSEKFRKTGGVPGLLLEFNNDVQILAKPQEGFKATYDCAGVTFSSVPFDHPQHALDDLAAVIDRFKGRLP